jgi:putative hydrolase of the HAD superfamily
MTTVQSIIAEKQAVIFDLFHTLTGSKSAWGQLPETAQYLGIAEEKWNQQVFEKSKDRLTGKLTDPVMIIKKMAHAINPSIPMDKITAAVNNRKIRFDHAQVNIPKANIETIIELKKRGKKIGLCSNADVVEVSGWSRSPLANLFDSVVFSCEAGFMKPEPQIYRLSLEQLKVRPDDAVFVGDGSSNELQGARAVGLTTIMVIGVIRQLWPQQIEGRRQWADYVIETIDALVR